MQLKTLADINLNGKTVLYRVAYDINPVEKNGKMVLDDTTRIAATLSTLKELLKKKCKITLLTWVKRPAGKIVEKLRTKPHAEALARLLGRPVAVADDCVGEATEKKIVAMKPGELLMLENVRFHPEEEYADQSFAKALCVGKDVIVFDAFGQAHRVHASTTGILQERPAVAGRLMEREVNIFAKILENPERPIIAILGGAKVSDKVATIRYLLEKVDLLLIGGALASTFYKGLGYATERSLVETVIVDKKQKSMDILKVAAELQEHAPTIDASLGWPKGIPLKLLLPCDLVAASGATDDASKTIIDMREKNAAPPKDWEYLDIGPNTISLYKKIIAKAKTIFWNGPMGFFEIAQFGDGTRQIADAIIDTDAFSVVAGGDTETIVGKYGLEGKFDHVSTGGGVSLELLAGKELPVLHYLQK